MQQELNILKENYRKLQQECIQKQRIINNHVAIDILDYLNKCNNLTETAEKFDCDPAEIYYSIPYWDDCNDRLYGLEDYLIHLHKLDGRSCELDDLAKWDKLRMRTPDKGEIDSICTDYNRRKHSLYELADKYDLLIINLFRLLKERGLIKNETDAFEYCDFYKEYIGEHRYNKYETKSDLGLIQMYYNFMSK